MTKCRPEIPREGWGEFLDRFSDQHRGWLVNIEVQSNGSPHIEASDLPLLGVSADYKGSEALAIVIMVGEDGDDHLTRIISGPSCIRFLEAPGGLHEGLEIESPDAGTTRLRFTRPARAATPHVM